MKTGFELVKNDGHLTNKHILSVQEVLERNRAGFRKLPGTELKNNQNGQIIYSPPQNHCEIVGYMGNLESFINNDDLSTLDPLIKVAIISPSI